MSDLTEFWLKGESEKALRIAVDIIGQVDVVDCVASSDSPWFNGPFGFVLANPTPLPFYACRGRQGLFDIEIPGTLL